MAFEKRGLEARRPLLVEFAGLPGAGKTTIAQCVIAELTSAGCRCFGFSTLASPETVEKKKGGLLDKLRTTASFISSCFLFPRLTKNTFAYAAHQQPWSLTSFRRLVTLIVRLKSYRDLMLGDYDYIILDQGVIQNIWSIAVSGKSTVDNSYLALAVKSVLEEFSPLLVMVDIGVEPVIERINHRKTIRSRFDRMEPSEAKSILSQYTDIFTQIGNLAEQLDQSGVLRIRGDQPIKDNTNLIVSFIKRNSPNYP